MELNNIAFLTLAQLKERLSAPVFDRPAVFLSASAAKRWGLTEQLDRGQTGNTLCWIQQIDPNPTQYTVAHALEQMGQFGPCDGLIAIGGGSAIDLAKAVTALLPLQAIRGADAVKDAIVSKQYASLAQLPVPIVAVPTTAGTGSEVTQWATIWDRDSGAKYSVDMVTLTPGEAWIVPELTRNLPPKLTLATGLDAVCHAAEAYWAKPSTPLVKALSLQALEMLTANLGRTLEQPHNPDLREQMATGALLAGLAFSRTRTTACHSISYPLTSLYGVDHGFACALTLAEVAEKNKKAADLTFLLNVFAPFGGIQAWMDEVCGDLVQLSLSGLGVPEDGIPIIVDNAFTGGRMDNNPTDLSRADVGEILRGRR